jgi:phosphoglycolate phosphatase-like HAD superfamily hydrolase
VDDADERLLNRRVVFDVDGTLLQSVAVDAELYARAFAETFGVPLPSTNWSDYANATDRGIAEEAVTLLSLPTAGIGELRRRFVELIGTVERIEQTAGAARLLDELRARKFLVAIATGGWSAAARRKLDTARLDVAALPLVGSDDHARREDIVAVALAQLGGDGGAVYIGDGPWDLAASRALGIGFIGVDRESHGRFGARSVRDFSDVESFLRMLENLY